MGKDSYKVELVPHEPTERINLISSGKVDVLSNYLSFTMDRDVFIETVGVGLSFSTPYYYLPGKFAGWSEYVECTKPEMQNKAECDSLSICVFDGTRYWDLLALTFPKNRLKVVADMNGVVDAFVTEQCNVVVGPWLDFKPLKKGLLEAGRSVDDFAVSGIYTLESLAIATRDTDGEWSDFVNWVFQVLLAAGQRGITKDNVNHSETLAFRQTDAFGEESRNMLYDAVATVGNYDEVLSNFNQQILP